MCRSSRIFVYIFILSLMLPSFLLRAQSLTQTVGGKTTERDFRVLLAGVNVVVVGADVLLAGSTNDQGEFRIKNVPVRRSTLKISYVDYKEKALFNLLITSGKEMVPDAPARMVSGYAGVKGAASANSEKVFRYLC